MPPCPRPPSPPLSSTLTPPSLLPPQPPPSSEHATGTGSQTAVHKRGYTTGRTQIECIPPSSPSFSNRAESPVAPPVYPFESAQNIKLFFRLIFFVVFLFPAIRRKIFNPLSMKSFKIHQTMRVMPLACIHWNVSIVGIF